MKKLLTITAALLTAGLMLAVGTAPAQARGCLDIQGERVFADVPYDHMFCAEIESLYRDQIVKGCGTNEDGEMLFCPNEVITRGMMAAFVEHRDPFAQVSHDGKIKIGDHVADTSWVQQGQYEVKFTRDVQFCSIEAWPHSLTGPSIRVDAAMKWGLVDTMLVDTTYNRVPVDMDFNLRLHCR